MRTLQVIETIRYIESLYDEETSRIILGTSLTSDHINKSQDFLPRFIAATHELARAGATIAQNSMAAKVLKAFDLEPLIDKDFITNLALSASSDRGGEKLVPMLEMIVDPWRAMTGCVAALEALTTPDEIRRNANSPNVLSLEMNNKNSQDIDLADISKVFELVQFAYCTASQVYGSGQKGGLQILKIDSGSSVRIDLAGEPTIIKPLRDFIFKAWSELRHQGMDKLIGNSKQILTMLSGQDRSGRGAKDDGAPAEDSEEARKKLLGAIFGLFAQGVRPADLNRKDKQKTATLAGIK